MNEQRTWMVADGNRLQIGGELQGREAELLAAVAQCALPADVELDLGELEIIDGPGAVAGVELVRLLLARAVPLGIHRAPQLLAHSLYRVGMLEPGSGIVLVATREEEPYG